MKPSTTEPSSLLEANFEIANFNSEKRNQALISTMVGSSCYQAISDDSAKDEDNAGWVLELELAVQKEWIERIRWIRLVDRLAEQELRCPEQAGFQIFLQEWQLLLHTGFVQSEGPYADVLLAMVDRWFRPNGDCINPESVQAWDSYVTAIARYHAKDLVIATLEQYEQMLMDLAGSFFQVLPFLSSRHHRAATHFGVLDQFYNHLRDLQEDAAQGICYLPTELLEWFNVDRGAILNQSAIQQLNYHAMMQFWLDEYLPTLRRKAHQLLTADDLHPSWQVMRDWSLCRYQRIDHVFRDCEFDYCSFSSIYWQRVQVDLPLMVQQVRRSHPVQKMPERYEISSKRLWGEWQKLMWRSESCLAPKSRSPFAWAS